MSADTLSILIAISLGVFAGTIAGLLLGYLLRTQKGDLHAMTRRQVSINAALILLCSALAIAGLAWYAFFRS